MNIRDMDHGTTNHLAARYRSEGVVVLAGVTLPATFEPSRGDVAFLQNNGSCEVFLDARVTYEGADPDWQRDCASEVVAGARKVMEVPGDFFSGLRAFQRRVGQEPAGPEPDPQQDRPLPDVGPPAPEPGEGGRRLRNLVDEVGGRRVTRAGREDALRALKTNLVRERKPGVVLLGKAGVGKTTLVELLAKDIAEDHELPERLRGVAVLELPLGYLAENAGMVGGLEREARALLNRRDKPVFFLDEVHQLARPTLKPLCDLLKPALAAGEVRVVAATTPIEWRQVEDAAFKRRFLELVVDEPSPQVAHLMLQERRQALEEHHELGIDDRLLREAILLSRRYVPWRALPDKALDLLDQASAMQVADAATRCDAEPATELDRSFVLDALAAQAATARDLLHAEGVTGLLEAVEAALGEALVGQDEAIDDVVCALRAEAAVRFIGWDHAVDTIRDDFDGRPLATILACGPTGVGKTQTAKIIADQLFEGRLVQLNGTDVGPEASHATSAWVGSPPGFVGSSQGGALTNALRQHGSLVILVDEVEKASKEAIQNILLPLLGDGVVVDRNNGEELSAAHAVVFLTSNLKLERPVAANIGFGAADPGDEREEAYAALAAHLRPELLGRLNAVVRYAPLDLEAQWEIWGRLRRDLERRMGEGTTVTLDEDARRLVQDRFNRMKTGARGLQDLFKREVVPLLVGVAPGTGVRLTQGVGHLSAAVEEEVVVDVAPPAPEDLVAEPEPPEEAP